MERPPGKNRGTKNAPATHQQAHTKFMGTTTATKATVAGRRRLRRDFSPPVLRAPSHRTAVPSREDREHAWRASRLSIWPHPVGADNSQGFLRHGARTAPALGVLTREVGDAAGGWFACECGVSAMAICAKPLGCSCPAALAVSRPSDLTATALPGPPAGRQHRRAGSRRGVGRSVIQARSCWTSRSPWPLAGTAWPVAVLRCQRTRQTGSGASFVKAARRSRRLAIMSGVCHWSSGRPVPSVRVAAGGLG